MSERLNNIDRLNNLLCTVDYMIKYKCSLIDATDECSNYTITTVSRFIHQELPNIDKERYKKALLLLAKNTKKGRSSIGRSKEVTKHNQ